MIYWIRSMLLIPCLHLNHHGQDKLLNMYISGWNITTPVLKAFILILRGCPLSRNSSLRLDHLQLFTNENCKMKIKKAWHKVLSHYFVDNFNTETHHPHISPAKRKIQGLKNIDNHITDCTKIPTLKWLRCIILWTWCWIMLQCPPLVGGYILRFP